MVLTQKNRAPTGLNGSNHSTSLGSSVDHGTHPTKKDNEGMMKTRRFQSTRRGVTQEQMEPTNKSEGGNIGNRDGSSSNAVLESNVRMPAAAAPPCGDEDSASSPLFRRSGSVKELRTLFNRQGSSGSCIISPYQGPRRQVNAKSGQLPVSTSTNSFLEFSSRSTLFYEKNDDTNKDIGACAGADTNHNNNLSPPPGRSDTANATFDCLVSPMTMRKSISRGSTTSLTNTSTVLPSPDVAVLQKNLVEAQERLRNQESRHIQERLSWQNQTTMELQRLREERDRLVEDKTNQRQQLLSTESIADAILLENKCLRATYDAMMMHLDLGGDDNGKMINASVATSTPQIDWEAKLDKMRRTNSFKETSEIGASESQLEETSQHRVRDEAELNTGFVKHLNDVAGKLRRQSSQKDLQIGVLAAQLDEKDQQLQLETDINTQIVANLRANEQELRRQSSHKDLTIERLTAELNESRGKLLVDHAANDEDDTTTLNSNQDIENEWMVEKFQKAHDQLKVELKKTKAKDSKAMAKLRKKLAQERSKLKRERQEVQTLKRAVVKESIQSIAVMSHLRDLLEQLQQKNADLQIENAALKSSMNGNVTILHATKTVACTNAPKM